MSDCLETERLLLRRWRTEDIAPFAAMNADPKVMEFLPALPQDQVPAFIARKQAAFADQGFGSWVLERKRDGAFLGFAGLNRADFPAHFTPCAEIGWRLAALHWGQGYAGEAASAALDFAFGPLALDEVVAFTVPANRRSLAVMQRLGMTHDPADDFEHPSLPEGYPLRPHALYRIRAR